SAHKTISHATTAKNTSETVYTFSFTTDWLQTVNALAPITAASTPPRIRCQRCASQPDSTRSVMRNHMPALTALHNAASMLIRTATHSPIGRNEKQRPTLMNNGFPGGCDSRNM